MTYYQLPTGKTILIDIISMLDQSDEEYHLKLEGYIADDMGFEINDPFFLGNTDEIGFIEIPDLD